MANIETEVKIRPSKPGQNFYLLMSKALYGIDQAARASTGGLVGVKKLMPVLYRDSFYKELPEAGKQERVLHVSPVISIGQENLPGSTLIAHKTTGQKVLTKQVVEDNNLISGDIHAVDEVLRQVGFMSTTVDHLIMSEQPYAASHIYAKKIRLRDITTLTGEKNAVLTVKNEALNHDNAKVEEEESFGLEDRNDAHMLMLSLGMYMTHPLISLAPEGDQSPMTKMRETYLVPVLDLNGQVVEYEGLPAMVTWSEDTYLHPVKTVYGEGEGKIPDHVELFVRAVGLYTENSIVVGAKEIPEIVTELDQLGYVEKVNGID
jgi:hypothetical protein